MSGMTRKEAIEILSLARFTGSSASELDAISEALDVAIEALKAERPHGEWISCKDDDFCECSTCKQIVMTEERSNFCPNCGAEMIRFDLKEGDPE